VRPPFEPGVETAAVAVALPVEPADDAAMFTSIALEVEAAAAAMTVDGC
jgi:hypothetical protein